jgi:hypothetical protein
MQYGGFYCPITEIEVPNKKSISETKGTLLFLRSALWEASGRYPSFARHHADTSNTRIVYNALTK